MPASAFHSLCQRWDKADQDNNKLKQLNRFLIVCVRNRFVNMHIVTPIHTLYTGLYFTRAAFVVKNYKSLIVFRLCVLCSYVLFRFVSFVLLRWIS